MSDQQFLEVPSDKSIFQNNFTKAVSILTQILFQDHREETAMMLEKEFRVGSINTEIFRITAELNDALDKFVIDVISEILEYLQENMYLLNVNTEEFESVEQENQYRRLAGVVKTVLEKQGVSSYTTSLRPNPTNDMQNDDEYLKVFKPFVISSLIEEGAIVHLNNLLSREEATPMNEWPQDLSLITLFAIVLDTEIDSDGFRKQFVEFFGDNGFDAKMIEKLFLVFTKYIASIGQYSYIKTKKQIQDLVANIIKQRLGFFTSKRETDTWPLTDPQ